MTDSERSKKVGTITQVASLVMAISAVIASIAQMRQPPPPEIKADAVYKALANEVQRMSKAQQQQHDDVVELRSWIRGYLAATGVKVVDTPGSPPISPVRVDVEPMPTSTVAPVVLNQSGSPKPAGVRVLTPLPTPSPRPPTAQLPANADSLP